MLIVLGAVLLGTAVYAWYWPPSKTEFAPQAVNAIDSTLPVEDRSETGTLLLVSLGVIAVLLAANGRKLASFKIAQQEIEFGDAVKTVVEEKAKAKGREEGLSPQAIERAAAIARSDAVVHVASGTVTGQDIDAIVNSAIETARADPAG